MVSIIDQTAELTKNDGGYHLTITKKKFFPSLKNHFEALVTVHKSYAINDESSDTIFTQQFSANNLDALNKSVTAFLKANRASLPTVKPNYNLEFSWLGKFYGKLAIGGKTYKHGTDGLEEIKEVQQLLLLKLLSITV